MIRSTGRGTSTDPNWVTRKDYTRFSFIYPRSEAPSNSSLQTRCIVFFNFGPSIPALCWKHAATHEQKSYQEVILEVKNHDMGCKDKGSLSKSPIGQEETWHIHKLLTNVRTTPTLVLCYELSPLRFPHSTIYFPFWLWSKIVKTACRRAFILLLTGSR